MPDTLDDHLLARIYYQLFTLQMPAKEVATANNVSYSGVRKWRQNWQLFGSPRAPSKSYHGRRPILNREEEELVLEYLNEHPTAYLDEVAWYIFDDFAKEVSNMTVSRLLHAHSWSRKVSKKIAKERSDELRAAFFARRLDWPVEQLVFVDESACCPRTGDRKYGWAPKNQRSHNTQYLSRPERFSVLPAISIDGYLRNPLVLQGSVNAELFNAWIQRTVVPQCGPGTIFIMDNASIHRTAELQAVVNEAGMRLEYLPPYSPDLNPIEQSFNVLKAWIRRHIVEAEYFDWFGDFLNHAIEEVSSRGARGWFAESGYDVEQL